MSVWPAFVLRAFALAGGLSLAACASTVLKVENSDDILANKEYDHSLEVKALPLELTQDVGGNGLYVRADEPAYVPPPSAQNQHQESALKPAPAPGTKASKAAMATKAKTKASTPAVATSKTNGGSRKGKLTKNDGQVVPADAIEAAGVSTIPAVTPVIPIVPTRKQPEIEDAEGFIGRRPIVDPFRIGESVTLELSYFGVVAGDMTLEVRPFVQVNQRKAYHFRGSAKSTSVFAMFYAVDDWVETFVDYEDMVPYNYSLHVKESAQLREVRSYFDWAKMRGFCWDKKVTKKKGVEEKKYEWDILSFAQNVFSAPFYLRVFKLEPGKKIQFRVGHEGKNIVVTGEVLRREILSTRVGNLRTVVIKPTIEIDGHFKPVGDILFWMTDDDRKFLVRIESKIKIGTVVGSVKSLTR